MELPAWREGRGVRIRVNGIQEARVVAVTDWERCAPWCEDPVFLFNPGSGSISDSASGMTEGGLRVLRCHVLRTKDGFATDVEGST